MHLYSFDVIFEFTSYIQVGTFSFILCKNIRINLGAGITRLINLCYSAVTDLDGLNCTGDAARSETLFKPLLIALSRYK